jgi:transposase
VTRDEAIAILEMPRDKAVKTILSLAEKAEKYEQLANDVSPTTPSGMTPAYLKPVGQRRSRKPGRKPGHQGTARKTPPKVTHYKNHAIDQCAQCQTPLGKPVKEYKRYIEDIPPVQPEVTEHTVHGYWCPKCRKIVWAKVTDALPNSMIGLRLVVYTAWLHYLNYQKPGLSRGEKFFRFHIQGNSHLRLLGRLQ